MINLIMALMAANNDATLRQAIDTAGLTTNLKLCLDAGDIDSYSGSGQKWLDRSGGGYDFFRGTSASSQSSDPTFTGSAGDTFSGTYWALDGGDFFVYDTTNESWMQTIHQNAAIFSALVAVYVPDLSTTAAICGTHTGSNDFGFSIELSSAERPVLNVGDGSQSFTFVGDTALTTGAWNILGMSITEAGGDASFMYLNGAYNQVSASNTFNASFTASVGNNANSAFTIGARGADGSAALPSGSRIAALGFWQGTALSKANFDTLHGILRTRFGIA